jgi:hypothetical protein
MRYSAPHYWWLLSKRWEMQVVQAPDHCLKAELKFLTKAVIAKLTSGSNYVLLTVLEIKVLQYRLRSSRFQIKPPETYY